MVIFMITVEEHQKTLSAKGINLPDGEVQKLLDLQYKFANIFFDFWVRKVKPVVVMEESTVVHKRVTIHKQNGNCVSVVSYTESYALTFAYDYK